MNRVAALAPSATRQRLRRRVLAVLIGAAILGASPLAMAEAAATGPADASGTPADSSADARFDRSMLSGAGQNTTDLSRFERGNFIPAGNYSVDIYLNDRPIGRRDVHFAAAEPDASATPCVTAELLQLLGLHPTDLSPRITADLAGGAVCVDIASVIPGASMTFEMSDLRLDVSVPQAYLGLQARGYVDPQYWDSGVTAGLVNYNFNTFRTRSGGVAQTSSYLGLNDGLNLGRWHLRNAASLRWQSSAAGRPASHHWQNIATYAQRDLPGLRAQLTVGDAFTSGEIFDSVGLRGVQIATDDRMLPQSLRGYAPVVRGTADSNARVVVRQNGMLIYQTTVTPGPFTITDLYATGYGGDFEVSVTEANGRVHTFSVPYASVPQLLRPGVTRFGVAAGQLRDSSIKDRPGLVQATMQHGFSNLLTGYAGMIGSAGYGAALVGGALNTRYGAMALDVSTARTRIPGLDAMSGQSVRLSYSKILAPIGTSLTVAAYRHSTNGYLDLADATRARDHTHRGLPVFTGNATPPILINGVPVSDLLTPAQQAALVGLDPDDFTLPTVIGRQRNGFSLNLSQRLGERGGSLYISGSARDYWNRAGTDTQFQIGYNNALGRVTYNLAASRERDLFGRNDNRYMLNLTVPLGDGAHRPMLTGGLAHDGNGMQEQATLSGTAGADDRYSYGASATHASGGDASLGNVGSTANLNAGYRGSHVQLNAGFGAGSGYSQASFNAAGGIIAHAGGINFSQSLGDTVALVQAPDADGARVVNAAGVRIDRRGYAVIPYVTPYIQNTISIDPTGLPLDVQLDSTSAQVAPRAGAVVLVKFKSDSGRFVLIQARRADGKPLPFGAEVTDADGQAVGMVGQAGRIMARVKAAAGELRVQWDEQDAAQTCLLPYALPARAKGQRKAGAIEQISVTCQTPRTTAQVARSGT